MLVDIFCTVLLISLMSLTIIVPILLIKALLKERLSAAWHYYIWLFLIIRLLIPYTPDISLNNLIPNISDFQASIQLIGTEHDSSNKSVGSAKDIYDSLPIEGKALTANIAEAEPDLSQENEFLDVSFFINVSSKLWLAGILILLIYFTIINTVMVYRINKSRISMKNEKIEGIVENCKSVLNIKGSITIIYQQHIKIPAVYGVIKPKLLLPFNTYEQLETEELRYIIMHELSHIKRRDTIKGFFQLLLCVIYWFNPVIWYAFKRISSDAEPLCDRLVLINIKPEQRRNYAETLIKGLSCFSANTWLYNTANMSQGSPKNMEWRLKLMNAFKKNSTILGLIVGVIIIILGTVGIFVINKNFRTDLFVDTVQAATVTPSEKTVSTEEKFVDRNGKEIVTDYIKQAVKEYLDNNKIEEKVGSNIKLTLDNEVQRIVDNQINKAIKDCNPANGACAIILNPQNGEVLAMVSKPAQIAPNSSTAGIKCISESFEPGSAINPLIACAALEEEKILPDSIVDDGPVKMSGYTIHCWKGGKGHGKETFRNAFINSCNPIFAGLAQKIGRDNFYKNFEDFGLNEKTGIELNGEGSSLFISKPQPVDMLAASLGQRFKITPIQLLSAYSAIANDGVLLRPHIIAGATDENSPRTVISSKTANKVKEMLEARVSDGTAKNAYIHGFRIAGSTGIGQDSKAKFIASFVGFAPVENPEVICIVILDGPGESKGVPTGSNTAAPVAAQILKDVFNYINHK